MTVSAEHITATEHGEQAALIERVQWLIGQYPDLELLYAVPNGGLRSKATAGKLKAEGARAGVPDLHLPVARHGFHGLYIEMKVGSNQPTKEQRWWHKKLWEQGYRVEVCYGQDAAWAVLLDYLNNEHHR